MAIGIKCYCFPTFKDLLAFYCHPFFQRECKGKGRVFTIKIYFLLFSKFLVDFQRDLSRIFPFFIRGAKIRGGNILSNFLISFCSHYLHFVLTILECLHFLFINKLELQNWVRKIGFRIKIINHKKI